MMMMMMKMNVVLVSVSVLLQTRTRSDVGIRPKPKSCKSLDVSLSLSSPPSPSLLSSLSLDDCKTFYVNAPIKTCLFQSSDRWPVSRRWRRPTQWPSAYHFISLFFLILAKEENVFKSKLFFFNIFCVCAGISSTSRSGKCSNFQGRGSTGHCDRK